MPRFEILKYGLLYVFSRRRAAELGYCGISKPILGARIVHLKVLAPFAYYECFRTNWFQQETNRALSRLPLDGYLMDFKFEYMGWPTEGNACSAVANRQSV